ncbi:MAG: hypothetical protein ACKVU4_04970 [Phycisphaerales bacterium]
MRPTFHIAVLVVSVLPALTHAAGSRGVQPGAPPVYVWWEAETPARTNFPSRNPFAPANDAERDVLSGGAWIGIDAERGGIDGPAFLDYALSVPDEGGYSLYARKFWKHGPFRWRFDNGGGAWAECGRDVALLDEASLRKFIGANWVRLGRVELGAGEHTLRVELAPDAGAGAFDCFVLVRDGSLFTPRGRLKPEETWGRAPEGWFAFEPGATSPAGSPISLRGLNEAFAGERGRIVARGTAFAHAEDEGGEPVRFWGVNVGADAMALDPADMDLLASRLAALGVNLVRFHGAMWRDDLAPDPAKAAALRRLVAALKREGVYTSLSIYFPLWLDLHERHGFAGYTGGHPYGLLFFNPGFQNLYRGWWREVLTVRDEDGVPLASDPAVAMIEFVNEDSLLFWTFKPYELVPGPQTAMLEKQFGDWLAARHGSVDAALKRWRGGKVRGDDPGAGRVGFMPLWDIANRGGARAAETGEFLAWTQRKFFEETTAFVKDDLGYAGLVVGSNWITADARVLGPLDKWSNAACDVMDRHGYYGGVHQGPRAAYAIDRGDTYADRSALRFHPEKPGGELSFHLPIMEITHEGKPAINSEVNWPQPNRWRAEFPVLAAAYGALQGTDGVMLFACSGPAWDQGPRKFGIDGPAVLGQSPAAALIYRRGLVREGAPVADAALTLGELRSLKGGPLIQPQNLDAFRKADVPPGGTMRIADGGGGANGGGLDPLAFLVGPVGVRFVETPEPSLFADLSPFIDRKRQVVRSGTGELAWDYVRGLVTIEAPAAAGIVGFFEAAGTVELDALSVAPGNDYASVLLVSLDGKPLEASDRMLLQVMTEESNFGRIAPKSAGGMRTIESIGGPPIVVKNIAGAVRLTRSDAPSLRVTPLDHDGRATDRVTRGPTITLEPATLWYLIER